jgi:hypothetical protein
MLSKELTNNLTLIEKIAEYISINAFKVGPNRRLQNVLKLKVCSGKTVDQHIVPLSFEMIKF